MGEFAIFEQGFNLRHVFNWCDWVVMHLCDFFFKVAELYQRNISIGVENLSKKVSDISY